MEINTKERRPIAMRDKHWAQASARWLGKHNVTPNQISLASIVCALVAGAAFSLAFTCPTLWRRVLCLLLAAAMIQGRLICNLLDGMVAVEGGKASLAGPVYNELPDRISDSLILIGVGYGLIQYPWAATLGWSAALLALMTAYLRLLGGTCGLKQQFLGPMAKQHRMATLFVVALVALFLPPLWGQGVIALALLIVNLGTLVTCWRRGKAILRELNHLGLNKEQADE
jgi:phosphatidylglycerophosphate synthase